MFDGIWKNSSFNLILLGEFALQVIIVEFGEAVFHTTPLDWKQWIACLAFAAGALPIGIIVRLIRVRDAAGANLERAREKRQQRMRDLYAGMTAEQMWKIENQAHGRREDAGGDGGDSEVEDGSQ
jgi:hypothetical protein